MKPGLRPSMAWLHTWTGLLAGWLMYFVFMTGSVGYFYVEVDRWMRPELPLAGEAPPLAPLLAAADRLLRQEAPAADAWWIMRSVGRDETHLVVRWLGDGQRAPEHRLAFDRDTGEVRDVTVRDTGGAYELYRMHWGLHYLPSSSAFLFVGVATMVMLVALLSGVVTHKKILIDFFTFRPHASRQRAWLDAHTVIGVTILPFFLMITYSGLAFYRDAYMSAAVSALYRDDSRAFARESEPSYPVPPAKRAAVALPLERFAAMAPAAWGPDAWWWLQVIRPGDANGQARLWRADGQTILYESDQLHASTVDGRMIREVSVEATEASWPHRTQSALLGLHVGGFAGPALRWLYFFSGLAGCVMIASGLVVWTEKRGAKRRDRAGHVGERLVDRLNIATIAGLPFALAIYFWGNRLLPVSMLDRATWEMHLLFMAWAVMFVYAALRSSTRAWVEEFALGALAFLLLPLLNAATTDRHLGVTLAARDWTLASVDLTMLATGFTLGAIAWLAARRARPREAV